MKSFKADKLNLATIEKYLTLFCYGTIFFVIILLAQSLILTLLNLFNPPLIFISLITSFIFTGIFLSFLKKDIRVLPRLTILPVLIIILVLLIFIFFPHDTFGGRDEAAFVNLAVYLAKNGTLKLPSYLNTLPDNYAKGVMARLPTYTVYLAIQEIFFGNQWLLRSNVILIGLGLCALFCVATLLNSRRSSLVAMILYISSMPFLWFSRVTLTENLAFFLLWSLVLFLLIFIKTKKFLYLFTVFICVWLYALTRIEGFFVQFSTLIFLIFIFSRIKIPNIKKVFFLLIYSLLIVSSIFITTYYGFDSYIKASTKGVTTSLTQEILPLAPSKVAGDLQAPSFNIVKEGRLYEKMPSFILTMLAKYNLVLIVFSIILIIPFIFLGKSQVNKTTFLTPLIIFIPELFKLISPSVTLDQPWFYRRYVYALLPLGYIFFSTLLARFNKRLSLFIILILLVINIITSINILFLRNNWLLIDKMNKITKDISKDDLVMIRSRPLAYYSPYSFLIIQKGVRSAYISTLEPSQLLPENKIFNGITYRKLFLLSNKKDENYLGFKATERNSIELDYKQLQPSCELYLLGEYLRLYNVYEYSMIPYSEAIKYCSRPENEIKEFKEQLFLYELVYEKEGSSSD